MVKILCMDESGFTGSNLLDRQQPCFTIASTDIDNVEAEQILRRSFPDYQGEEFKFQTLWRTEKRRRELINFATHLGALQNQAFVWMADKRFAVLTKVVDFLIEPIVHNAGYNFYANGFCWKYTNLIYYGFHDAGHGATLDRIIHAYQKFSRHPCDRELLILQEVFDQLLMDVNNNDIALYIEQMALGAHMFRYFHDVDRFTGTDDLQFTSMLATIGHWRQNFSDDFIVVHDESSNFSRQSDMWRKITSSQVSAQRHPVGDGTTVPFPLRVVETRSVDSISSYSVQFCDVLAGLGAKCFAQSSQSKSSSLMNEILQAGLANISFNGIRFQAVFPDRIPPDRLNGDDAVDQMTKIIFQE